MRDKGIGALYIDIFYEDLVKVGGIILMKRKMIIGLMTVLLLSVSTVNAYAWGYKTHSYLENTYANIVGGYPISKIATASEFMDAFNLYKSASKSIEEERNFIVALEIINAETGDMSENTRVFIIGVRNHFNKDTESSMKDLDKIFKENGQKYFYRDNGKVPEALSDVRMKGYVDTYTASGVDAVDDYYSFTKNIPYEFILKTNELTDMNLTINSIQKNIIANNISQEAIEKLNWNTKFIAKNKEAELVAPKLDNNTTTTIKSYFDSKLKKPTETNPISYPSSTIEGDAEFNKNLESLTKAKVDKLISDKVLELKDSGEIILKDKAQYNRAILELNKEISSYTSKYYAKEDVNKDGTVDRLDLAEVAQFYNTVKSDKGYLEKEDINKDGIIDVYDLVAISKAITPGV